MKKFILLFIGVFTLIFNVKAQDGIEGILFADVDDTKKLTRAYMNPAMKGLIYGMNNGWYHSAKVHKKFGFDISIGLNASMIPSKDEIFDVTGLNLSTKITNNPATSPTVGGGEVPSGDIFEVTIPANSNPDINGGVHPELVKQFTMPGGVREDLPLNAIPTPVIQLSLGLPFKMDAMLRLVPNVGGSVKGNLLGLGLKKEITEWFGPIDRLPLHVSLLGAFTNMKVSYNIEDEDPSDDITIANGRTEFKLNSYTIQALASLNFPIINVYGAVGYSGGSSTLRILGTYDLDYNNGTFTKSLNNPLNLGFSAGGFRTTIGARVSLGFFKLFTDYTLQEYNTVSAGIAFSIR